MEIPVLVEPISGGRYRASALSLSADGATAEAALSRLKATFDEHIAAGARLLLLNVSAQNVTDERNNPWRAAAGIYRDDPLFDDWVEAVREYRRQREAEEDENNPQSAKAA